MSKQGLIKSTMNSNYIKATTY